MRGSGTQRISVISNQPWSRGRTSAASARKHGFSHPLAIELLEERMPLDSGAVVNAGSPLVMTAAAAPPGAAPVQTGNATAGTNGSSGGDGFPPISASHTPAALLFDPHQPAGDLPADVTSGNGPPLQQGAPPRFSYNLETNITGEGDGAANEVLIAPSHSGGATPNGVPTAETIRGLPFDINQEVGSPTGVPRFSFGPQTGPRSPLENRDLPGLRPGMAPSPNNRTNPTQPSESAPGTQPITPRAYPYQGAMQETGAASPAMAAARIAPTSYPLTPIERQSIAAGSPLALDLVAADLASVLPLSSASSIDDASGSSLDEATAEHGTLPSTTSGEDTAASAEGAMMGGAMLTAAREPRHDNWPLDEIRRVFQWPGT